MESIAVVINAVLWVLKVLGGAVVISIALGAIILVAAVAREAAWVLRYENRKKYEKEQKQEEEK